MEYYTKIDIKIRKFMEVSKANINLTETQEWMV